MTVTLAPRALLIAGPTASGKSALALAAARARGGVVINADSMQVYRELRVLTARPSRHDEAQAPHKLYGHVPAAHPYSVAQWIADVRAELAAAEQAGQFPIIVGGTGLYFMALLQGLSPIPQIPQEIREKWREASAAIGARELHARLASDDPETASRLRPSDRQRVVRALEVLEATGRSLTQWQQVPGKPVFHGTEVERVVIEVDRANLYRRCDARFDEMMEQGALDEVRRLVALDIDPALPAMRALGVAQLIKHLTGGISMDEAVARSKIETRQYVKRQLTWLRRNMCSWKSSLAQ